eukprot:TRINITY_DN7915_c0_g1_i1.p2 TRINITY_DN7915_c0_g1~~TRINITY_DN7915_c0_g1_i1.p2  ORF type:complete len:187 (+),score=41.18 TRINITY_DN7915_c0_g1_i1:469-1029(+)
MREEKAHKFVVVVGTSVGGAASIMAAAENPGINAVIAENPVACAEEFALFHLKKMVGAYAPKLAEHWVVKPFYKLVTTIMNLRIGAGLFGYDTPLDVVHKISPRPIMFMHGTADDLVPPSHSQRLFANAKEPKYLWLAQDAWHCALYDAKREEYSERVSAFLESVQQTAELPEDKEEETEETLSES